MKIGALSECQTCFVFKIERFKIQIGALSEYQTVNRRSVGPVWGPNCLKTLSADNTF